jgi:hypothetical protein
MAADNPDLTETPDPASSSDSSAGAWGVHPYLLALLGALGYGFLVFVTLHFIPWIWDMHYELLRRFVMVGFAFLAALLAGYAHRHKGWRFWLALALVASVYSVTTWEFSSHLRDIGPWHFRDIAGLQLAAGYFFIEWFTRQGDLSPTVSGATKSESFQREV